MSPDDFHDKPFDEGTLTKLHIFELYAREWFPVFLSPGKPVCQGCLCFSIFSLDLEPIAIMFSAVHYVYCDSLETINPVKDGTTFASTAAFL